MGKFVHKHNLSSSSKKLVFLISIAGLLGAALIANFLWASSSSPYSSVALNLALEKTRVIIVSKEDSHNASSVSPLESNVHILKTQLLLFFFGN